MEEIVEKDGDRICYNKSKMKGLQFERAHKILQNRKDKETYN